MKLQKQQQPLLRRGKLNKFNLTIITLKVIVQPMIKSFSDKSTEALFNRQRVKKLPSTILKIAYRKLLIIDSAERLDDLKIPPGNRLEKLAGNLSGKFSIRINEKWRIIFSWKQNNAYEVEIIDYHKG